MSKKKTALVQNSSSTLLKVLVFLAKLKKPIIPILVSLVKTRKLLKRFKPLKHYNHYTYVKEYEFSPSSTPLIHFRGKPYNGIRVSFKKMHAKFAPISECFGMVKDEGESECYLMEMGLEPLPCGEDDSVDERAERFIQRFYEEIRMQRLEM